MGPGCSSFLCLCVTGNVRASIRIVQIWGPPETTASRGVLHEDLREWQSLVAFLNAFYDFCAIV